MRSWTTVLAALTRWAILAALLAAGLFLAAGTTHILTLRAFVLVFSAPLLLTMLAVNPRLAQERVQPGAGAHDVRGRFAAGILFLTTMGFAAMDVGRLHESNTVPGSLSVVCLIVFEDVFLTEYLPDYREYKQRVRGRLFPRATPLKATALFGGLSS